MQDSKKLNINGIGLGLMISKQIVEKFGGKISFTSEPDVGSNFTFTFKLSNPIDNGQNNSNDQLYN